MLDIAVDPAARMAVAVAVAVAVDEGVCVERNEDRDEAEAEGERMEFDIFSASRSDDRYGAQVRP